MSNLNSIGSMNGTASVGLMNSTGSMNMNASPMPMGAMTANLNGYGGPPMGMNMVPHPQGNVGMNSIPQMSGMGQQWQQGGMW